MDRCRIRLFKDVNGDYEKILGCNVILAVEHKDYIDIEVEYYNIEDIRKINGYDKMKLSEDSWIIINEDARNISKFVLDNMRSWNNVDRIEESDSDTENTYYTISYNNGMTEEVYVNHKKIFPEDYDENEILIDSIDKFS